MGQEEWDLIYSRREMKVAECFRKELFEDISKQNTWSPFEIEQAQEYWKALQIIREWTKLNHASIHDLVIEKTQSTLHDR